MANRYGEAALMAVRMETFGKAMDPRQRWDDAIKKLYPTTPAAQRKSGPRKAFVDLCEAGLVRGVPAHSSHANRSASQTVQAVHLLAAGTHTTVTQLWNAVQGPTPIAHASQMDVVLALWKNGLLLPQS